MHGKYAVKRNVLKIWNVRRFGIWKIELSES